MMKRTAFCILAVVAIRARAQAAGSQGGAPLTAEQDHQLMMTQLGIRRLRPGPSGNEAAPNHANYDEATANPFPVLPDPLTLKNGKKVTTAALRCVVLASGFCALS